MATLFLSLLNKQIIALKLKQKKLSVFGFCVDKANHFLLPFTLT